MPFYICASCGKTNSVKHLRCPKCGAQQSVAETPRQPESQSAFAQQQQIAATPGAFTPGGTQPSPFGQQPADSRFGQSQPPSPFGQQPADSRFGQPQPPSPFGQQPTSPTFGRPERPAGPSSLPKQQQQTQPSFCPNCGTQVTGRFCPSCGTQIVRQAIPGIPAPSAPRKNPYYSGR